MTGRILEHLPPIDVVATGRATRVPNWYGTTKGNFAEVTGSLADARERLARIEGHLGIGLPPPGTAAG